MAAATTIVSMGRLAGIVKHNGYHWHKNKVGPLAAISVPSSVGAPLGAGRVGWTRPQFMVVRQEITTGQACVAVASVVQGWGQKEQAVPLPVVHIDQSEPDTTIVELSFGDRLGALLDTTKALKNLGLTLVKAQVTSKTNNARKKLYITQADNSNKVEDPEVLEAIRLTIISNLLKYHPESSEQLFLGETYGITPRKQKLDVDVATQITVKKIDCKQSLLTVDTPNRPGLLLDIIKVITDISILVESTEINTEGLAAKNKFYVSHDGAALSKSLEQVLLNCLKYYIRKFDCDDES